MIELIRKEFQGTDTHADFEAALATGTPNQYQSAFSFLHARRGQTAANQVVRAAVWSSLDLTNWPSELPPTTPRDVTDAVCRSIETDIGAWYLPPAVASLGRLLVDCTDAFGHVVLTTNFDPLIGVSIAKHGGKRFRTVLHSDGALGQTTAEGTHIVHLHGYWCGADTLHTPQQLARPRPQLHKSLVHLLEGSTLVVIGYGGWDDVIASALVDVLSDSTSNPEIMWCFHENDADKISASNAQLLATLDPGIGRGRVSLYRGIDCAQVFDDIHRNLESNYFTSTRPPPALGSRAKVTEQYYSGGVTRGMRVQIEIPFPNAPIADPDRPLFAELWVGREHELRILTATEAPVAFITGIGGQGKSALAAELLRQQAYTSGGRFELWDWRDCREESDRLRTQVLRLIERLTDGAVDASRIEAADTRAVVRILFQLLDDRKALLVFDNVDQYVDLETFELVKDLDVLVSEAQSRNHRALFLFTCRPDVRVDESRTMTVSLQGLDKSEILELVRAQDIRGPEALATDLQGITDGHPLWVNLILMQARRSAEGLRRELQAVRSGGSTLPDTTRRIWHALNEQQRTILRTMAELDRPETNTNLTGFLPGINFNRINRALKVLRAYHLIEHRPQVDAEPLLDLHPIIREFVRTNFPKKDREHYVGAILEFLDRQISRFKDVLPRSPTYEIMDHWIRKAELHVTFERFEDATSTIAQVGRSLSERGYSEALIRVSIKLFERVNWAEACSSFRDFDVVFQRALLAMVQAGHGAVARLLTQFEAAIPGKSAQFILLCDLHCYADWYNGNFSSAIRWGERGEKLKRGSSVDTQFSTAHNLALARRDAGFWDQALSDFLGGESLDVVLAPDGPDNKHAQFFGNVGRCLCLAGRLDDGLLCYVKCARLLDGELQPSGRLNKGYIRLWFGDLFEARGEHELAATMYRAAAHMWHDCSPPRADAALAKLYALTSEHRHLSGHVDEPQWQVETVYADWLTKQ